VIFGINRLGYVEFSAARKLLSRTSLRRAVQEEIQLHELRTALADVQTVEGCWHVVRLTCRDLRFASAHLQVNGKEFFEQFEDAEEISGCEIELTLGHQSWLVLKHSGEETSSRMSMSVPNQMQSIMRRKLQELEPALITVPATRSAA
jgi:hypothetical protein